MSKQVIGVLSLALILGAVPSRAQGELPRVTSPKEIIDTSDEQELRWPVAVAVGGERVGVADAYGSRFLIFARVGVSWTLAHEVALSGPPAGLARLDDLWILSVRGRPDLAAIDDNGNEVAAVPLPAGLVAGPLAAAGLGNLLVYDAAAFEAVRVDRQGAVSGRTAIDGYVTALAAIGDGGFLAAVGDQGQIHSFDAAGELQATWDLPGVDPLPAWPSGLAMSGGDRVFVTDRYGGRIIVLDGQGRGSGQGSRQGRDPGLLQQPGGIAISSTREVLVADLGNGRVQVFTLNARF